MPFFLMASSMVSNSLFSCASFSCCAALRVDRVIGCIASYYVQLEMSASVFTRVRHHFMYLQHSVLYGKAHIQS